MKKEENVEMEQVAPETRVVIDLEVMNNVLEYLSTKPWAEANEHIQAITGKSVQLDEVLKANGKP